MLNIIAKSFLVSTSLAPVWFIMGVSHFERGNLLSGVIWTASALVSVVVCWTLLRYVKKKVSYGSIYIKEFERKDQQVLTFLFIYVSPLLKSKDSIFGNSSITSIACWVIIILAIASVNAFHFNPVMRLLGYRFYSVKNRHGVSNLLISKEDLRRPDKEIKTAELARNVYLHTEDENV